ncbi:MAG TPA: EscU/YscU/HrcU family type III secretion system export apparatus switch protein [Caulobacteraceae bacterium]|jgi:flagellar biosynthetic protein FlhB|nr:EscU/YscU/HrcU family type III secretion system export apparatus switch protein [Caulobacteraceae bacterium]
MEDATEQDRSEAPTRFKLDRARREGSVARGLDLGFLGGFAAFIVYLWAAGHTLGANLALTAKRAIVIGPDVAVGSDPLLQLTGEVFSAALRPLAMLVGAVFLTVLALELVQTGFVFSFKPLQPNFGKLNPTRGLKRLFTPRILIETGKNVLKLAVYVALAVWVIAATYREVAPAIADGRALADAIARAGFRLLTLFLLAAVFFAILDQLIVRRDFLKRMRMSRREVRREMRDREGDPRLKQRRRQVHREFAKLSRSLRNIRGADVLITNPAHYAVALKYDTRTMAAPKVVSRGANQHALRLKRAAFLYGVVIVEDRPLARALYQRCDVDREVPETCFRAVADIYRRLRGFKRDATEAGYV